MNDTPISAHIPLSIAAFALCVFLAAQIGVSNQNGKTLRWQETNLAAQVTSLNESEKLVSDSIQQREALVKQSDQVKAQYSALLTDVLELAKTDSDAAKVVEKYNIKLQADAGTGAGADAAPEATPDAATTESK